MKCRDVNIVCVLSTEEFHTSHGKGVWLRVWTGAVQVATVAAPTDWETAYNLGVHWPLSYITLILHWRLWFCSVPWHLLCKRLPLLLAVNPFIGMCNAQLLLLLYGWAQELLLFCIALHCKTAVSVLFSSFCWDLFSLSCIQYSWKLLLMWLSVYVLARTFCA